MHEYVTHSANIELAPAVLQVVLACYSLDQRGDGVLVWEWGSLSGLILPLVNSLFWDQRLCLCGL